jgi:cofilin
LVLDDEADCGYVNDDAGDHYVSDAPIVIAIAIAISLDAFNGRAPCSQSSGVPVNGECVAAFQELKLGKKLKFIIFKLNDTSDDIIVDQKSEGDYEKFLEALPADEPRWAVFDFEFEKGDAGKRNKITFISW